MKRHHISAELAAERAERNQIKKVHGCAACANRGERIIDNHWTCGIKQKPKPLYCDYWWMDDDAEVLK